MQGEERFPKPSHGRSSYLHQWWRGCIGVLSYNRAYQYILKQKTLKLSQHSGPRIDQHLAGKLPGDTLMVPLVPTRGVDLIVNIGIQGIMR